jgi:tetratricopeptide (TPR) repeat protein
LLYIVMELPVMLFLVRFPVRLWRHPRVAPAAVFATLLGLYMIDCTLNGFINLIYVFLLGGLISVMPTELGMIATGLKGPNRTSGQIGLLARHVLDSTSHSHALTGHQPNHILSGLVADRMAMAARYRVLGRNLKSQERWADTHSAWQQAFDILTELTGRHPESPDLQRCWCDCSNDLAWLLLKHPEFHSRGLDHALTLAMEVVDKRPDGAVYWNTLGAAYLRNGEPGKAIAALDRASALADDDNPFNHVFLAMAYAQLGDREQARHRLAQAIFLTERDYQNHHELACFCDEARAAVGTDPEAVSTVI